MSHIAVVYHSGYGHTKRMAEAVAAGANATLYAIDAEGNLTDAQWEGLAKADSIIMGSPTYMGSVTWQFKNLPIRHPRCGSHKVGKISCSLALPTVQL